MPKTYRIDARTGHDNAGLYELLAPQPRVDSVSTVTGALLAFLVGKAYVMVDFVNQAAATKSYLVCGQGNLSQFETIIGVNFDRTATPGAYSILGTVQDPGGGKYNWEEKVSATSSQALQDAVAEAVSYSSSTKRSLVAIVDRVEDNLRAAGYSTPCMLSIDQDSGVVCFVENEACPTAAALETASAAVDAGGELIDDIEVSVLEFE